MIKSFFTSEEPEKETGIDWLDVAIAIANKLVALWINEIENNSKVGRVGNAAVLKTDDT